MNATDLVYAIKAAVYRSAAKATVDVLAKPPGRHPDDELVELSQWFHQLSPADRHSIARVVDLAANQATYNFLLVLDGLLAIEPAGEKGKLELFYDDGKTRTRLNDESAVQLSYLFKEPD